MNVILKTWRKFKLSVAKHRQNINVDNKFQIGDFVNVKDQSFDLSGSKFYSFRGTGEVVDAYYGYQMNLGYKWYYKVQYKRRNKVIVDYEESEIQIDIAWIREQKLKKLGI